MTNIFVEGNLPQVPGPMMKEVPYLIEVGTLASFYLGKDSSGGDIILVIENNEKDGLNYSVTSNNAWVHEAGMPVSYKEVNLVGKEKPIRVTNPNQRDFSITAEYTS